MHQASPIVWLTGNTGAGKSTLAFTAQQSLRDQTADTDPLGRIIVLDGDEMRDSISTDAGFAPEDRRRHNLRVARLARVLSQQQLLVIVAVIAPFDSVRQEISKLCQPRWVYVKRSGLGAPDKPYDPPSNPDLTVDSDRHSIPQAQDIFQAYLRQITGS